MAHSSQIKRDNIARVAVRTARQERQQRKQHFAWKKNYKEEGKQHTNKLVMEFTQMQKEEEEKRLEEAKQRRANIETAMEVSDAAAASAAHHHQLPRDQLWKIDTRCGFRPRCGGRLAWQQGARARQRLLCEDSA